jgi:hypothetical protein
VKLIIREIGMVTQVDDDQDYDDSEPTPDEGDEVHARWEERKRSLAYGGWCYIGVQAGAELMWVDDDDIGTIASPMITTPGVWKVESDSGNEYLASIYRDELSTLREMLKAMGFTDDDINERLSTEEVAASA